MQQAKTLGEQERWIERTRGRSRIESWKKNPVSRNETKSQRNKNGGWSGSRYSVHREEGTGDIELNPLPSQTPCSFSSCLHRTRQAHLQLREQVQQPVCASTGRAVGPMAELHDREQKRTEEGRAGDNASAGQDMCFWEVAVFETFLRTAYRPGKIRM